MALTATPAPWDLLVPLVKLAMPVLVAPAGSNASGATGIIAIVIAIVAVVAAVAMPFVMPRR